VHAAPISISASSALLDIDEHLADACCHPPPLRKGGQGGSGQLVSAAPISIGVTTTARDS
jgi:hypothetical protein